MTHDNDANMSSNSNEVPPEELQLLEIVPSPPIQEGVVAIVEGPESPPVLTPIATNQEPPPIPPVPMDWEERCGQLERQLAKAAEATQLRKRLIEIRETESKCLTSKLKVLSESISEEKRSRTELLKRVEAAELECATVKDKLRRNLEALERVKGHHERRVTMLSANLEIADIKAQGTSRKLEESHRKCAEQKGLLEELTMKLNENRKVTKGLEKQLKISLDKNTFLTSQLTLIGQLLGDGGDDAGSFTASTSTSTSASTSVSDEESLWKIKNIIRQSENASAPEKEKISGEKGNKDAEDEDEGVELSSLRELDNDNDSESETVNDIPGEESCYKRVDTSAGPKFVLSVSRTFIKLKDLILEKRSLQQEIDGLKNLNTKLGTKVDKQEHRLYCVTKELNKTWYLVSKLKVQQDRLHNNEAFLRYELKENRAIVERLKKEMISYKEKWRKVREKNDESQCVWQQLKDEFAQRRQESQNGASSSSSASSPSPPPLEAKVGSIFKEEDCSKDLGIDVEVESAGVGLEESPGSTMGDEVSTNSAKEVLETPSSEATPATSQQNPTESQV